MVRCGATGRLRRWAERIALASDWVVEVEEVGLGGWLLVRVVPSEVLMLWWGGLEGGTTWDGGKVCLPGLYRDRSWRS